MMQELSSADTAMVTVVEEILGATFESEGTDLDSLMVHARLCLLSIHVAVLQRACVSVLKNFPCIWGMCNAAASPCTCAIRYFFFPPKHGCALTGDHQHDGICHHQKMGSGSYDSI